MPYLLDRSTIVSRLPYNTELIQRTYNVGDEVVIIGDWDGYFGRTVVINGVHPWTNFEGEPCFYYTFDGNTYTEADEDGYEEEYTIELYSDDIVTPEEWRRANSTQDTRRMGITQFWSKVA